ncbi:MAG: hypothetical protein ACK4GK_13090 [Ferrovibrio sp.]
MVLLLGCAKTNHDAYPEGWPQLTGIGPDCRGIAGIYSMSGSSSDPRFPAVRWPVTGTRIEPPVRWHVPVGKPDMLRLSFIKDDVLRIETGWYDEAEWIPHAASTLVLASDSDSSEHVARYNCDEHGLEIPPGPHIGVAGYNSYFRGLIKAEDGSLVLRDTSSAAGVWVFPPFPMISNSTTWYRFEAAQ